MKKTNLIVVIPANNERASIGAVIKGVKMSVPNARILVVDDGSTDGTSRICKNERVEVLRHNKRMGLGRSIREGLKEATDRAAIIDADGEYWPGDLGRLVTKLDRYDLVLGSRFLGKKPEMGLVHKLGNMLFSCLVSLIIGQRITDAQTGLRALNKKAVSKIKLSGGYTYTQEMILLAAKNSLKIVEVPARYTKRKHGESKIAKNPFLYALRVLPKVIKCAVSQTDKTTHQN